ncbi:hypothetical protein L345_15076, partial [Ophiophagus hannah]
YFTPLPHSSALLLLKVTAGGLPSPSSALPLLSGLHLHYTGSAQIGHLGTSLLGHWATSQLGHLSVGPPGHLSAGPPLSWATSKMQTDAFEKQENGTYITQFILL